MHPLDVIIAASHKRRVLRDEQERAIRLSGTVVDVHEREQSALDRLKKAAKKLTSN